MRSRRLGHMTNRSSCGLFNASRLPQLAAADVGPKTATAQAPDVPHFLSIASDLLTMSPRLISAFRVVHRVARWEFAWMELLLHLYRTAQRRGPRPTMGSTSARCRKRQQNTAEFELLIDSPGPAASPSAAPESKRPIKRGRNIETSKPPAYALAMTTQAANPESAEEGADCIGSTSC